MTCKPDDFGDDIVRISCCGQQIDKNVTQQNILLQSFQNIGSVLSDMQLQKVPDLCFDKI